jgi:hypothetical protein
MLSDSISNSENQYEDEEVEDDIEGDLVDDNNTSYLNRNIVVSLDDKYVGVVFEGTIDKILEESEAHDRFEISKCKIMMWPPSINKILDLEYVEILRYKVDIMAKTVVIEYAI